MHENIAKSQYEVPAREATKRAEIQAETDRIAISHHARLSSWGLVAAGAFGVLACWFPALVPVAIGAIALGAGPTFLDSIARLRRKSED